MIPWQVFLGGDGDGMVWFKIIIQWYSSNNLGMDIVIKTMLPVTFLVGGLETGSNSSKSWIWMSWGFCLSLSQSSMSNTQKPSKTLRADSLFLGGDRELKCHGFVIILPVKLLFCVCVC